MLKQMFVIRLFLSPATTSQANNDACVAHCSLGWNMTETEPSIFTCQNGGPVHEGGGWCRESRVIPLDIYGLGCEFVYIDIYTCVYIYICIYIYMYIYIYTHMHVYTYKCTDLHILPVFSYRDVLYMYILFVLYTVCVWVLNTWLVVL